MKLFLVSFLFSVWSSNLLATENGLNENPRINVSVPRILRGIHVEGASHVGLDGTSVPSRYIPGKFGFIAPDMDWSTFQFEAPKGVRWTDEATQKVRYAINAGCKVDVNPIENGFSLSEDTLNSLTIEAHISGKLLKMSLNEALKAFEIDGNGILRIKFIAF